MDVVPATLALSVGAHGVDLTRAGQDGRVVVSQRHPGH